jgi:hypothetical protein
MQVDALALHLRPRSMSEAVDLGVRLVQANARSVWFTFAPLYLLVALVALASGAVASWLPGLIIFWLKPWFDRTLLFVLSRAVFGTPTRLADVWAAQKQVWWTQWLPTLTLRRLSRWRAYTQAAAQLEGQRGTAWRARCKQLLRGKAGAAFGMHSAFAQLEMLLVFGVSLLALWLVPQNEQFSLSEMMIGTQSGWFSNFTSVVYVAVVLLVEPFYVGAGFVMYLNRRVELEAWDIEQEFRLAFTG